MEAKMFHFKHERMTSANANTVPKLAKLATEAGGPTPGSSVPLWLATNACICLWFYVNTVIGARKRIPDRRG